MADAATARSGPAAVGGPPRHRTWPLSDKAARGLRRRVAGLALLLGCGVAWQLVQATLVGASVGAGAGRPAAASRRLGVQGPGEEEAWGTGAEHLHMVDHSHLTKRGCPVPDTICIEPGKRWLLALYLIGILYMFLALAVVCDEFFVPSLEVFVDKLGISMDVAGATFMAAGGSMPELFTSFIGTFQGSDIGFATIVGSAVFNVLFVIGVCAVASKEPLQLSAWPLARDCLCYTVGLLTLVLFFVGTTPGRITLWEASVLLAEYAGYCVLMKYNDQLQALASCLLHSEPADAAGEVAVDAAGECSVRSNRHFRQPSSFRAGIVELLKQDASVLDTAGIVVVTQVAGNLRETFDKLDEDKSGFIDDRELGQLLRTLGCTDEAHAAAAARSISRSCEGRISFEDFRRWYLVSEARVEIEVRRVFESLDRNGDGRVSPREICLLLQSVGHSPDEAEAARAIEDILRWQPEAGCEAPASSLAQAEGAEGVEAPQEAPCSSPGTLGPSITFQQFRLWYDRSLFWQEQEREQHRLQQQQECETEAAEAVEGFSLDVPEDARWCTLLWYALTYPICAALYITMPDVRRPKRKGSSLLAVVEFMMSLGWIALFSFCLVDWVEVSSNTLGIPTPIAGVTVLAAGTSVPDLLTSYIVTRRGEGDMAVSSSIGSNIFDILVGLALPWLLFNLVYGEAVRVRTTSLGFSVLVLVFMLLAVLASIACMRWRMTRRLGCVLFLLYALFMAQDILQQFPVGHPVIPPMKF